MVASSNTRFTLAVEQCLACATACDRCVDACLADEASDRRIACIRKALDCATVCRATAELLGRGSDTVSDFCRVCIAVCLRCESECRDNADEACTTCASACSRCEDALRAIA